MAGLGSCRGVPGRPSVPITVIFRALPHWQSSNLNRTSQSNVPLIPVIPWFVVSYIRIWRLALVSQSSRETSVDPVTFCKSFDVAPWDRVSQPQWQFGASRMHLALSSEPATPPPPSSRWMGFCYLVGLVDVYFVQLDRECRWSVCVRVH